jgi:hypothetical protein
MTSLLRAVADALQNKTTGLGTSEDVQLDTEIVAGRRMGVGELDLLMQSSALAWRSIWQLAFDVVRKGFSLVNVKPADLDIGELKSYIDGDYSVRPDGSINRARGLLWYVARLLGLGDGLGGAVLIPLLDDGMDPIEPLDVRRIKRITGWVVLDRREITPWSHDGGEPEYYVLSGSYRRGTVRLGDVWHKSRLWVHEGMPISDWARRMNGYWGVSKLELTRTERLGAEASLQYLLSYMHRSSWIRYAVASMNELLKETDDDGNAIGEERMQERMQEFRRMITTLGVAIVDGGTPSTVDEDGHPIPARNADQVDSIVESVGGLPEIHDRALTRWQVAVGMPRTIALGEQAPGIGNNENIGDWQSWEGTCDATRVDAVTPLLTWCLILIFSSVEGPTKGVVPTSFSIEYNRLVVQSADDQAKTARAVAEADGLRISQRVVLPEEVREQRVVGQDWTGPLRASGKLQSSAADLLVGTTQVVFQAALAVQAGQLSPEAFAALMPPLTNARVGSTQAQAISDVLRSFPAPSPQPQTGQLPVSPDVAADDEDDADANPEDASPDLLDFSADAPPPGGLSPARAIKARLRELGFSTVTVQQIRKLAREREIRVWRTLGREPEYSLAEVVEVLRQRIAGGRADAAEPDLATIYGWLIEHYTHARKLSAPRIHALLELRDKYSFLRPAESPTLFRGLYNVSPARVGRLVGPTSPVRDKSWTTSRAMARRFAQGEFVRAEDLDDSLLCVVMEAAPVAAVMLLDAAAIASIPEVGGYFHELWGMTLADAIREEAEVIVYGSLDVGRVEVVRRSAAA